MAELYGWYQFVATFVVSISAFMFGSSRTWFKHACLKLLGGEPFLVEFTSLKWLRIVYFVGCCSAPIPCGIISEWIGKKYCILFCAFPFLIGWILTFLARSYLVLLLSRFFVGMGGGITMTICPLYVGEIATPTQRGACILILSCMYNIGHMYGKIIGRTSSYEIFALANVLMPVPFFVFAMFVPHSPYYLAMKGKEDEAFESLLTLRGDRNMEHLQNEHAQVKLWAQMYKRNGVGLRRLCLNRVRRLGISVLLLVLITNQMTGMNVMSELNQDNIVSLSGSPLNLEEINTRIGLGNIAASLFSAVVVDKVGRRVLLYTSVFGTCIFTFVLGMYLVVYEESGFDSREFRFIPITCVFMSNIFFKSGLSFSPFLLTCELVPSDTQGIAAGICVTLYFFIDLLENIIELQTDRYGSMILIYSILGTCAGVVLYYILPETKLKSVLALTREFNRSPVTVPIINKSNEHRQKSQENGTNDDSASVYTDEIAS